MDKGPILFMFAIVSDVQYADRDNGWNYLRTSQRFYRGAANGLQRAVDAFTAQLHAKARQTGDMTAFMLQLGDLIDGFNAPEQSEQALEVVLRILEGAGCPVHHSLGNHELYNFRKEIWKVKLPCSFGPDIGSKFWYSFSPSERYRFIGLDSYDISTLGTSESSETHTLAKQYLTENPNEDKNSPLNLQGSKKRFTMFNGAFSKEQLDWLCNEMAECERLQQNVVIFTHIPLHPSVNSPGEDCLLWNYEEALSLLYRYSRNVLAVFCGHTHYHRYTFDEHQILHYVCDAIVECSETEDAYTIAHAYADRIEFFGKGKNSSVIAVSKL